MKHFLTTFFCALIALGSFNASAQESQQTGITAAMTDIFAGEGAVTQRQYDSFWSVVGVKNQSEKRQVIIFMRQNFLSAQDYQREVWECAKTAWIEKKNPECSKLKVKFNIVQGDAQDEVQKATLANMEKVADMIIQAAADHGTFALEEGSRQVPMSLALINSMKENLDKCYARFDAVLNLEYVEKTLQDVPQDDQTASGEVDRAKINRK